MFSKPCLVICAFAAIAMAQLPAPTCYSAGASFSSSCAQFVNNFCDSAALIPARVRDSIGRCYNLPNNNVCDFIAWNTRPLAVAPNAINCRNVLNNVIGKCPRGGFGQVQNGNNAYTFTVDINRGQCGHDVHAGS